jgi:hypothetical protein
MSCLTSSAVHDQRALPASWVNSMPSLRAVWEAAEISTLATARVISLSELSCQGVTCCRTPVRQRATLLRPRAVSVRPLDGKLRVQASGGALLGCGKGRVGTQVVPRLHEEHRPSCTQLQLMSDARPSISVPRWLMPLTFSCGEVLRSLLLVMKSKTGVAWSSNTRNWSAGQQRPAVIVSALLLEVQARKQVSSSCHHPTTCLCPLCNSDPKHGLLPLPPLHDAPHYQSSERRLFFIVVLAYLG